VATLLKFARKALFKSNIRIGERARAINENNSDSINGIVSRIAFTEGNRNDNGMPQMVSGSNLEHNLSHVFDYHGEHPDYSDVIYQSDVDLGDSIIYMPEDVYKDPDVK